MRWGVGKVRERCEEVSWGCGEMCWGVEGGV